MEPWVSLVAEREAVSVFDLLRHSPHLVCDQEEVRKLQDKIRTMQEEKALLLLERFTAKSNCRNCSGRGPGETSNKNAGADIQPNLRLLCIVKKETL